MRLLIAVAAAALVGVQPVASEAAKPNQRLKIAYHRWSSTTDFAAGVAEGVVVGDGTVRFDHPTGRLKYDDPFGHPDRRWDYARWTSPEQRIGFGADELVASWIADAPSGTWLQVEMRGTTSAGGRTKWYVLGRWAGDDAYIHRTSVPNQGDADGSVSIDTFIAGGYISSYQLRVTLYRLAGTARQPALRSIGAMAASVPSKRKVTGASPSGGAEGIELAVPRYSQNIHLGEYPQWDGGGEAWCSPTSTSMVVAHWGAGPTPNDYSWVDPSFADPWVDHAARGTYDYRYQGTGNWSFNTAYAGRFGLDGFVTRLHSLTELEQFIRAGIPVITSQSFKASDLPGAGYGSNGHLMVVVGFTRSGDVIANDPAAPSNAAVRRVYPRANFERVWQQSTSGIVYVITPEGYRLPPTMPGVDPGW